MCGPVVDACPKLLWLQSTFAGCNQLLTASTRRDYAATRLAGCFGPCMTEYAALHILALERRYEEQRAQQRRREWIGPRDAPLSMNPNASSTSAFACSGAGSLAAQPVELK